MVDIEIRGNWVEIRANKCLLVLTKAEFIASLKRGKAWRRRQALAARLVQAGEDAGISTRSTGTLET
jgi:hypothetical protein